MSEYRVQLEVFSGPLDLLLYLIRRDELEIQNIPLARVAEQYLEYVRMLEDLDPNSAGEFLVLASTLVELKSRALLPTPPAEGGDKADDPRGFLVRQLLEYKRFKDAARALGTSADERARRYVRVPANLPPELAGVELEEAEVWDLLAAFNKVMTAVGRGPGVHQIQYDDTPVELHAAEIIALLERDGPTTFQTLFDGLVERPPIVGKFLAMLELIRNRRLRAEQDRLFGAIYLFLLEEVTPAAETEEDEAETAGSETAESEAVGSETAESEAVDTEAAAAGAYSLEEDETEAAAATLCEGDHAATSVRPAAPVDPAHAARGECQSPHVPAADERPSAN